MSSLLGIALLHADVIPAAELWRGLSALVLVLGARFLAFDWRRIRHLEIALRVSMGLRPRIDSGDTPVAPPATAPPARRE